ncbi:hypothetical protein J5N97_000179 [Dioscorea zingiberensis]|uniref:Uncharacterized protein n=1 Tax=Dioscorea zingiberensis TaxID=325984 RepID=A0A9D5H1V6_9LILI|nr:hypothetical protein J5N97_000179 [Dioscorea zingiberensis]
MPPLHDRTLGTEAEARADGHKLGVVRDERVEQGLDAVLAQAPSIRAPVKPENPPPISESKKRALDALERRFAAAAKSADDAATKRQKPSSSKDKGKVEDGLVASPQQPCNSPLKSRVQSGPSDAEGHPAYSGISQILHDNLKTDIGKVSNRGEDVNKVVRDILMSGEKGYQYAKGSRNVKFDSWILLDNFVPKNVALANSHVKALKGHSNRSRKHMSMRKHRECGSFHLPQEFHKFDRFLPMHEMWKEYIIELLKEIRNKQLAQSLLMADLHGAILSVVECKTAAFKGVQGIMIRETVDTFGIITKIIGFKLCLKKALFIFSKLAFGRSHCTATSFPCVVLAHNSLVASYLIVTVYGNTLLVFLESSRYCHSPAL